MDLTMKHGCDTWKAEKNGHETIPLKLSPTRWGVDG
jgi:hypothetical protein